MPDAVPALTSSAPDRVQAGIERGDVTWELLMEAAERVTSSDPQVRATAEIQVLTALDLFKESLPDGEVRLMVPVGGFYLSADGEIECTVFSTHDPNFDWSAAWELFQSLSEVAEEAREWWRSDEDTGENEAGNDRSFVERLTDGLLRPVLRPRRLAAERRPHSASVFNLHSWLFQFVIEEEARHGKGSEAPPSADFVQNVARLSREIAATRLKMQKAIQRSAQTRYWYGVVIGAGFLTVFCVSLGIAFSLTDTAAFYGVAIPAGGLGAMVSVLQRMSSGRLTLDTDSSRDLLELFGGVRPFIGAVFGIIIAAALLAGLVPSVKFPADQSLAFFAVVGFLAGFNERWAQDMLNSSAGSLNPAPPADAASPLASAAVPLAPAPAIADAAAGTDESDVAVTDAKPAPG